MRLRVTMLSLLVLVLVGLTNSCKKASAPSGPHACTSDDECVVSCDRVGDCCHNPYCESAQHRDDAKEAVEINGKQCTQADHAKCPQIGARMEPTYRIEVHCRASSCVVDKLPLTDAGH